MKNRITLIQLFWLTFFTAFSGYLRVQYAEPLLYFLPVLLSAVLALALYPVLRTEPLQKEKKDFRLFAPLLAAELAFFFFETVKALMPYAEFAPPYLLFAVLLGCVIYAGKKGFTVAGRFSEVMLLLLLPFCFLLLLPPYRFVCTVGDTDMFHLATAILPLSFVFPMGMTAVAGDANTTDAMNVVMKKPKNRALSIGMTAVTAAFSAAAFRLFLYRVPLSRFLFFVAALSYIAHFLKLVLLFSAFLQCFPKKGKGLQAGWGIFSALAVFGVAVAYENQAMLLPPLFLGADLLAVCLFSFLYIRRYIKRKSEP